jgi:hypothetical protein
MSHRLLSQFRRMLRAPGARFHGIKAALKQRRLKAPATPMTDQELARAIRDFQAAPVSEPAFWNRREDSDET